MGEFGRSPRIINTAQFGANGRDHWPRCYTALFAGGGVIPGAIYGSSDKIGAFPSLDPVSPDDLAATMFWALGIDPETEVRDKPSIGRCRSRRASRSRRSLRSARAGFGER